MKVRKLIAFILLICIFVMAPVFEVLAMQIQIKVEINENSIITLEVGPTDRIFNVKDMIQARTNIKAENQTLFFGGEEITDDNLTLEDCSITDGATITLVGPYTVTLNMSGHGDKKTVTVKYGGQLGIQEPTAEGFAFIGWYTDEALTEGFDPQSEIYADTVLYAKWVEAHTVTIKWDGHANDQTLTVRHGEHVVLPTSPTVEGYTFYWFYTNEGLTESFDPDVAINSDIVLYTKWYKDCIVSFDTCGIGDTVIKPRTVKYGETMELPDPPVAEGYSFDYWYWYEGNDTYPFTINTSVTKDVTLYAHWKVKAENTITVDNITFHLDNYPIPDQPITKDGIYIEVGEEASLVKLLVGEWSEWDYYAFDENRLPVQECKMSEDSSSVTNFRAGKYYMCDCRIYTDEAMDSTLSIEIPSLVFPLDTVINVDCPDILDYQSWPWMSWTDPETEERMALVLEVALVFKAPEYKVIDDEITDTTYEEGTDDVVTLHFNGDLSLFDELIIDGNVVPKDQYTLKEGSTIVTLKSSYLDTLGSGDHTVTAVYNTNMYNEDNAKDEIATVITIVKSEEKPAEQDDSPTSEENEEPTAEEDKPAEQENAPVPKSSEAPINVSTVPNTGDITSITGYLVSGVLSLAGIVAVNRKKRK